MAFAQEFGKFFKTSTRSCDQHAKSYILGLIQGARGERNIERMEEVVPGLNYEGVQQFISNSPWDHDALNEEVARQADGLLGGACDSRLIIDESAFAKKGTKSVGVARQYNGRLGKVDNSQVGVFASLSAGNHALPVGFRLYLPQAWCEDPKRCKAAGIPESERVFKTKAELALDLVRQAREQELRFSCVVVDAGYGHQPGFLRGLDAMGECFVAEVHCTNRVELSEPWFCELSKGKERGREMMRVDQWVAACPDTEWERLKVRDGRRGAIEVNYLAQRVWVWDAELQECKRWWVLAWKNPDEGSKGRVHYALSNAGADADVQMLIKHGAHRYWVERNFQDAKSEAGLADYQVRGWLAWHHHVSLVMLTMLFMLREKLLHQDSNPELPLSCGDIVFVLSLILPKRETTTKTEVLTMLARRRMKRLKDERRRQEEARQNRPEFKPLEL